jgi:hypothetical protein
LREASGEETLCQRLDSKETTEEQSGTALDNTKSPASKRWTKFANMDTSMLLPGGPDRRKQIQDAKDMYQTIVRNAERTGSTVPPYQFLELIGKGSFGRVYKW